MKDWEAVQTDRVETRRVPWLMYLFVIAVFAMTSVQWTASLRERDGTARDHRVDSVAEGSMRRRVMFSALGLVGLASLIRQKKHRPTISDKLGLWMLLIVLLAALSLAWTADIGLSIRRLISFLALCVGALAVSQRSSLRALGYLMFWSSGLFLAIGVVAEVALGTFTPLGDNYRFAGTQHPNNQGLNCSLFVLSTVFLADKSKKWRFVYLILALAGMVFLVLTKSRTSFAGTLLALMVYKNMMSDRSRRVKVLLSCLLIFLIALLVVGDSLFPMLSKGILLGRSSAHADMTFSGRTYLWMECRAHAKHRPFLGYGFNGFWTSERIESISKSQGWPLGSAHSIYMDMLLELGLVGLSWFLLILFFSVKKAYLGFKNAGNIGYCFLLSFLTLYVSDGVLESIFLHTGYFGFMSMVAFASLGFSKAAQRPQLRGLDGSGLS